MDLRRDTEMRRRTPAVNHCLRRAAEAEQLAQLADDISKFRYGKLASAWRRLARNAEFTGRFKALLKAPRANVLNRDL
jgi:hypothetical protein